MIKFLFFDNRDFELVDGFRRRLQQPVKRAEPLIVADRPWENGNITMFGSVLKVEGRPFQCWYNVIQPSWTVMLAYAESEDGINWRKPELDLYLHEGRRTNIIFAERPLGPAVIYDTSEQREDWMYKMICGDGWKGGGHVYHSADGIHWLRAATEPAIENNPDCPMGLLRRPDGVYATTHRVAGGGRRIGRSESDDFVHWHGRKIVLEPGPGDPPQFQMYGMGIAMYGDFEIGTLWDYETKPEDTGRSKMRGQQQSELAYSRNGWAWHRAAQGQPFIAHGSGDDWDGGNLQAASAPVYLADQIRYYYAGTSVQHAEHWELTPGRYGISMATLAPDRFMALVAGTKPAELLTRQFTLRTPELFVNAKVARNGMVQVELLDAAAQVIPGFEMEKCISMSGDSVGHQVRWQGDPSLAGIAGRPVRWRLRANNASLYSVWMPNGDSNPIYHHFSSAW